MSDENQKPLTEANANSGSLPGSRANLRCVRSYLLMLPVAWIGNEQNIGEEATARSFKDGII